MNVVCLSATEPGRTVAGRLPYLHVHGDVAGSLRRRWREADAFVVILAVGATVRLIAPLLTDKAQDPAVVCVDDAGRYAVAVCGGHAGGGNALAEQVAGLLGAEPVVTTATDLLGVPALDQLPGMAAEGDVARVTATVLAGAPVAVETGGWPLPPALEGLAGDPRPGAEARIVVTDLLPPLPAALGMPTVVLRPRSLVVGVGSASDATVDDMGSAVADALAAAGLSARAVDRVATVDRRVHHPAVVSLAASLGAPLVSFGAAELETVPVPNPSDVVRAAVGTPSVAEAASLLAAGPDATLVAAKRATARVTVAVARRRRPAGSVSVVGLGPGGPAHRTPTAERAVRRAEVVIGFTAYVEQCRDLLTPGQAVRPYPLGAELERVRAALAEAAAGRRVAVVCSGDAGVYAMASPLLELVGEPAPDGTLPFAGIDVEVVPGVTASLAAAGLLGAPLGHDHAVVSLSDLHTPWERIAARVHAAAEADLVLVLYNPRSRRRAWQLDKALAILRSHRPAGTPVGLVTDAGRSGQRVLHSTIADLPVEEVTMTTCVVVGSTTTRLVAGRMVTPRGYDT